MERHASKRDVYGIPIVKAAMFINFVDDGLEEGVRTWSLNVERRRLREKTETLRGLHYTIDFLEKWMSSILLAKRSRMKINQDVKDISRTVDDEIEWLEAERKDTLGRIEALLDLQRSMAAYLIVLKIDYIPDVSPLCNPSSIPRWLLRAFHDDSHCHCDHQIGILSSGYMWSDPRLSFDDLITAQVISEISLRDHCRGTEPTPFISMAEDAAWWLDFVKSLSFPKTTRIAFINVKKLELTGVVHGLGSSWAMKAGAELYSAKNRDGIHYLGPTHWLAYGWIPVQCIDDIWSLSDFRQVCNEPGISEGSNSLLWLGS